MSKAYDNFGMEMRLRELIPPDQLLPEQIILQRSRKDLKMLLLIQSPR